MRTDLRNVEDIRKHLSDNKGKEVSEKEMSELWKSLSIKERTALILTGELK